MKAERLDRLAILTVAGSQSSVLMRDLSQEDFRFTIVNTSGGVVQEALVCLLVGFSQARLEQLLQILRRTCPSRRSFVPAQDLPPGGMAIPPMLEAELGGALIRVVDVDRFEQF